MKFKPLWAKTYYYKRIIAIMMIFSFFLFLPFSFISYEISQKNIIASINNSNKLALSQLNYNYGYFSKISSNICMESFLNNTVQQFLYSSNIDYNKVYSYMKNMSDTTMQTNSSIDSIVIYNSKINEWFSTESYTAYIGQELTDFISTQQSIPKLQPILRKIIKKQGNLEIPMYVFSYFMYQFSDPVDNMDSYIVVNENADWFLDNLATIKQTGAFTNSIYLINKSGIIYSNDNAIDSEISLSVFRNFWNDNNLMNEDSQYNFWKHDNKNYLISSMQLGSQNNYLVIIQDYNDVFRDLLNLRKDYLIFSLIFLIAIIIMLQLFSKRIYSPMQIFMNHISKIHPIESFPTGNENEFDYLNNIYQKTNALNEKLLMQSEINEPVIEQFQLMRLTTNTLEYLKAFEKACPNHWLMTKEKKGICVLQVKIDSFKNNRYHFADTDLDLLTYAVRNIILELFAKEYEYVSSFQDLDMLCIIADLSKSKSGSDAPLEVIERCQSYISEYLDVTITVSCSAIDDNIMNLNRMYQDAKEYLQYRFVFGAGSVINRKRCLINLGNEQMNYSYELDNKLITAIRDKNISSILLVLEDIKNTLHSFQYTNITMCMMTLVNKIAMVLNQMKQDNQITATLKVNSIYKNAVNAEFMGVFFQELGQYISSILGDDTDMDAEHRDVFDISAVIEYVQNNYSNPNLTSQMISDHLGLSNRYIMSKFKECTGSSLNEYIVDLRMRRAANLLQNTNLPINKIVMQVGIENDTYFYRLFKKVYHCTPREFSEKYRKMQ